MPAAYHRDGSLYLTKMASIKQGTFYGAQLGFIASNPDFYVNIDTVGDWIAAEQKLPTLIHQL